MTKRRYAGVTDLNDKLYPQQLDSPENLAFFNNGASNIRYVLGADNYVYQMADSGVTARGTKTILWSSEGFTYRGAKYPALTPTQKKATGNNSLTTGATAAVVNATSSNAAPSGYPLLNALDVSQYKTLVLMVNVSGLSGGTTPSIQFEIDALDDVATPNSIALAKPAALTATGGLYIALGQGAGTAPTVSGWTISAVPFPFTPQAQVAWTVTGGPTTLTWTAYLYGLV